MDIRKRKLKGYVALSVLIIMCLIIASAMTFFTPNNVNAFQGNYTALKADDDTTTEMLLDGYETGKGKVFNGEIFWKLISKITGESSPTTATLAGLGSTEKTSADFRANNSGSDVVVIIDGIPWTATYLSQNATGDPILTLWQADAVAINYYNSGTNAMVNKVVATAWGSHALDSLTAYASNVYGTSFMATNVLNNGGNWANTNTGTTPATQSANNTYAKFTMPSATGSLTSFIEVPNNVPYQKDNEKESAKMQSYHSSYKYDANNDCLGAPISANMLDAAHTYYDNTTIDKTGYLGWGDDRIWLPSLAEVGYSDAATNATSGKIANGLWQTSTSQRSTSRSVSGVSANDYLWLRSATYDNCARSYLLTTAGTTLDYVGVAFDYAVRPAFHLNLSKAANSAGASSLGQAEPTDITVEYDGDVWNASNFTKVPNDQKGWFDSSKMTVTFPPSNVKDVGTYQVTVTITTDDEFVGEPNTEKGENSNNKERIFNFTIIKKKIGVTISPDGKSVDSEDICEKDEGTERAPTFGLTYSGRDGTSYNTPDVYPTAAGKYRATAKILTNGNNYELIGTITQDFEIKAKDVDKPTISGLSSLEYNGAEREFTINKSADVAITAPDGMRYENGKLYAKNAGTYKIKMSLVDDGVAKQWTDLKNTKDRDDIELTITPAPLTITFNGDTWSWNSKSEKTVTFSDNRFGSGDSIDELSFNVYYDTTPINNVTTDHAAKTTTVTIPPLDAKSYSLKVSIKVSDDDDSKNYKITNDVAQRSFTVSDKEIEVNESNIVWKYSINNSGENEVGAWSESTTYSALTYDKDKAYYFFAELEGIAASDGVTAKWETKRSGSVVEYGKDADTYTTTVTLSSDKVKFKNNKNTFTLNWVINKALFDLTTVKWNYSKPLQFNDKEQEVVMTGIPDGLTFNYRINSNKKRAVGTYTAEVLTITVRSDIKSNYVTPEVNKASTYVGEVEWTLNWEIKKGELELEWEPKEEKDVNDKIYSSWQSTTYTDKIEYRYYTLEAYADGALTGKPIDKSEIIVPDEETEIEYYIVAVVKDTNNYEIVGTWAMPFVVGSLATVINISMASEYTYDTKAHGNEWYNTSIAGMEYVSAEYFKVEEDGSETSLGATAPTDAGSYIVRLSVDKEYLTSYQLSKAKIAYVITKAQIEIEKVKGEYDYDSSGHAGEFAITTGNYDVSKIVMTYFKGNTKDLPLSAGALPCDAGDYLVVLSLPSADSGNYEIKVGAEFDIKINKAKIAVKWVKDDNGIPTLSGLDDTLKSVVGYVYYDEDGNPLDDGAQLEVGKSYKVKAIFLGDNAKNYEFVTENGQPTPNESAETDMEAFTITAGNSGGSLGGITGVDGQDPSDSNPPKDSDGNGFDFGKVGEVLKAYWQPILCAICIILIIIFMSKGMGYAGKRKKIKKTIDKKYNTAYYAVGGVGLFGLPYNTWTVIASIMVGVAVLAFIFMILQKKMLSKAEEELEDVKDEYAKNQKEAENKQMQMMLMGMMGGNSSGGQGFAYPQGVSADEMRLMINDAMSNMLPNVTQYLPQQASSNDELVHQLMEQNAQNEERIRHLTEQNEEKIRQLTEQNEHMMERLMDKMSEQPKESVNEDVIEKLVEKLAKQQIVEKEAEKEAAATLVNEKTLEELKETIRAEIKSQMSANEEKAVVKTVEKDSKDDKIEMLMRNQEMLMKQIVELTANRNNDKQIVVPFMPQPAEKVVEKFIPVPVEKVVEKEIKVEVPVEKIVPMAVEKPAPKAKTTSPRLSLDEAYAKLSANQKKIFDTLKNYALSKDKCKEKKSTYFTVLGQSTVNPLVKLTIKKNTTVAMFKMEDEYFKDIRRGASSDGTKVKVKESEVVVSDAQALATAKNMIDLREDQIGRYNEYLKEQKSMRKK